MRRDRLIWVLAGVGIASMVLFWLYLRGPSGDGWFPGCLFHRLTGLSCPGCGMTRGTYAALHGRFGEALRYNPPGMIAMFIILVIMGIRVAAWVRDVPQPRCLEIGPRAAWWITVLVLAYWVLRNIPGWPFALPATP